MTNKPMLSVEPIKLVAILASELNEWPEGCDELFQTSSGRVIGISSADDEVSEKIGQFTMNSEGNDPHVTRAEFESAKAELTQKPAAQHQVEPVALDERVLYDAWRESNLGYVRPFNKYEWSAWKARARIAKQPAPVADHDQCEECKGWGYHENHHEGGGTECGECSGSGNAILADVMAMPDRMKVEPFTTIDRGSKNYKAGYNAAIAEVAKLNGLKT